ncbi:hypothetical protein CLV51_106118 [Chitinophaga niastensis]|uniref:Uncharacterized protein n=1 Tax=Chitinophaga niastensis TaxID=536980 RepID=A0A2P8HDJ4_CHINA|nr:hypothetical protein [Chitinophaga niastensis]PSL44252.1 hypothetical protein CLV51_106118 [Chitinophaga niastensis]
MIEDKDAYSEEHAFSIWEGLDFELTTFKEILKDEQLEIFLVHLQVQDNERHMTEQDNSDRQLRQLENEFQAAGDKSSSCLKFINCFHRYHLS